MSSAYGLTAENFLRALPEVLQRDEGMLALASAVADALEAEAAAFPLILLYPAIDALPEDLLDLLAYDFKVDWWNYDWDLEQKQASLKESWRIHRILGTPKAVDLAVNAAFGTGTVEEWWEYGAPPHHFRVTGLDSEIARKGYAAFRRLIAITKRESSRLDAVVISTVHEQHLKTGNGLAQTRWVSVDCERPEVEYYYLVDEDGAMLADEANARYIEIEEE